MACRQGRDMLMLRELQTKNADAETIKCPNELPGNKLVLQQAKSVKTAVTLCLVPEASAGPFVYHGNAAEGFSKAAQHGYDAVELFVSCPSDKLLWQLQQLVDQYGIKIAAVNSGAGAIKHGFSVTCPDKGKRRDALKFIAEMADFSGRLKAPMILSSIQGRWVKGVSSQLGLSRLKDALKIAGDVAANHEQPVLYGPLNRVESNLINSVSEAADWIRSNGLDHVKILADMFHLHMERVDMAQEIISAKELIGHVHYTDSNRCALGMGRIDPTPAMKALEEIGYRGYLSAAVFPMPDADQAALTSIQSMKSYEAKNSAS